ncbi:hypothetical protein [Streptomyces canus]|uniref:hypothetical protein n=1 Tax=Streptomyces canus TaxID=58343 RepID=UPI003251B39B
MTDAAQELRAAAAKIRDLATRTNITLERHELQWTDLTAWAGPGTVSPMVWSQHAAVMSPAMGLALAAWLDSAAEDAEQIGPDPHALAVARALTP